MSNERKWTSAQTDAINSLDGTVLVSAAAGSGKTAVLVERIIKRITDSESPSSIEKLLVVTFTKAAAAEMKERLSEELSKHIEKDPKNLFLRRQKIYLSEAQICTMDSFCAKLVRENYDSLGISPDFSMLSENDNKMYLSEAADFVLNDIYENGSEGDFLLLELFTNEKDDQTLRSVLMKMYDLAYADPEPEKWIDFAFAPFFEKTSVEESACGKYTLSVLKERILFCLERTESLIRDSVGFPKLEEAVRTDICDKKAILEGVLKKLEDPDWDSIRNDLSLLSFNRFTSFSAKEKDAQYEDIKARRDIIKDDICALSSLLVCTAEDFLDDIEALRPVMLALKNRLKQFINETGRLKNENNAYYFTDILHFSLALLYRHTEDGEKVKTDLAIELQDEFDEILIDEFQDTNEAQVSLFDAISKDGSNEFIVGDVKQSIYSFRQACPEIFVSLLNSKKEFDGKNYPAKIYLDSNFRSRKGVIDGINFCFDRLMLPKIGGLDYKKTERLVFAQSDYDEHANADVELHIVYSEDARKSNLPEEAEYIGSLIKKMIAEKHTVGVKEKKHQIQYRDICILLRSVKNKASVVAGELTKMGIPVHYKKEGGFFENAEIMTVISLLKIIDNPISDVPLLSVLLSPLTPFSEDDIARIRASHKNGNIYNALKSEEENSESVKEFLDMLDRFRTLSVTLSVADLIRRIFETTSYDSVVSAMDSGESRVLNLQKLISYAENYNNSGKFGLSGFIRYIDKLQKNGFDLEGAETVSENDNAVRIMTFHKSKGLEFPVVILANTAARFRDESKEKLPINKSLGAGALRYLPLENREINTQVYSSVIMKNEEENTAENLRLLYVAMTRAREKLIIVGSAHDAESKICSAFRACNASEENLHVGIKNLKSFFDWVLFSFASHPSFSKYSFINGLAERREAKCESPISIHLCEQLSTENTEKTVALSTFAADMETVDKIREKVSYVYPYDCLAGIETKYTASSIDRFSDSEFFASEEPAFLSTGKITPAKRGTLIHRYMEHCDLLKASLDANSELQRLVENGIFTETEANAVNIAKINKFFESDMFKRITSSEKFLREEQFTMSVPLNEIVQNPNLSDGEFAVVQGVVDGCIINGKSGEIIDYKTDRVASAGELCERYKSQMAVYKRAAQECFGAENVKVTLYSFELSQEISVNFEKNT